MHLIDGRNFQPAVPAATGEIARRCFDCFGDDLQNVIHIGLGRGLEQAEAEAGAGAGLVEAHGHQHVAWLGGSGVAGRTAADGDAFQVERDHQRFAFQIVEPDVGGVGDAGIGFVDSQVPGSFGFIDSPVPKCEGPGAPGVCVPLTPVPGIRRMPGFEAVARAGRGGRWCHLRASAWPVPRPWPGPRCRARSRFRRGGGARGCRPPAAIRCGVPRRTNIAPMPLGPCILWALMEQRWHPKRRTSKRDLARALHGVDVEEDAGFGGDLADLFDGLQDAGLVVGQHDADQARLGPDGAANIRWDR